jgi:hypothetical protein
VPPHWGLTRINSRNDHIPFDREMKTMSMGKAAGKSSDDDDDDTDVALLLGDGRVVANRTSKSCDTIQQEPRKSFGSPNTPHAQSAQPLESHSMLSMIEHWEPAMLRSDGSVVANHKVRREDSNQEDPLKSNGSPEAHPAHTAAQPLECHSMSSMSELWEPPSLSLSDGRTTDLACKSESGPGHVCLERLLEWSHDSPASKQALDKHVPGVYLPSFEDGAVATEAVGPQSASQTEQDKIHPLIALTDDDNELNVEVSANQTEIERRIERFSQPAMVLAAHGHQDDSTQLSTDPIDECCERLVEVSENQTKIPTSMINDDIEKVSQPTSQEIPSKPPSASNAGWTPEAVWLPTDDGPVNVLLNTSVEYRGTLVLLSKRPAWRDDSPTSGQAVVELVRNACRRAGFEVYFHRDTRIAAHTLIFVCACVSKARYQRHDSCTDRAGSTCKFRLMVSWLPNEKRWACKGGYGHCTHVSETCRRLPETTAQRAKVKEAKAKWKEEKARLKEAKAEAKREETKVKAKPRFDTPSESSWAPTELLLPTDTGPCNVLLHMGTECRGTVVKLERTPMWCDNTPASKRSLAKLVQSQCLSSGFAVTYDASIEHKIAFTCPEKVKFRNNSRMMRTSPSLASKVLKKQSTTGTLEDCRFRFSLVWRPNENCWAFLGGRGRGRHVGSACRRPQSHSQSSSCSGFSIVVYERSWTPRELLLPTDSGSVNILKLMNGGRQGSFIRMAALDKWHDDTAECRRALAQWVQSTCILSGFEVACLSLQRVPLDFVCKETQNVWTHRSYLRRRLKKRTTESGTDKSPCQRQMLEKPLCRFRFSLLWLPDDRRWAYQCGRGHSVHKNPSCCRRGVLATPRVSAAVATNPSSWAIRGNGSGMHWSAAYRGSATLHSTRGTSEIEDEQKLIDLSKQEKCFPCASDASESFVERNSSQSRTYDETNMPHGENEGYNTSLQDTTASSRELGKQHHKRKADSALESYKYETLSHANDSRRNGVLGNGKTAATLASLATRTQEQAQGQESMLRGNEKLFAVKVHRSELVDLPADTSSVSNDANEADFHTYNTVENTADTHVLSVDPNSNRSHASFSSLQKEAYANLDLASSDRDDKISPDRKENRTTIGLHEVAQSRPSKVHRLGAPLDSASESGHLSADDEIGNLRHQEPIPEGPTKRPRLEVHSDAAGLVDDDSSEYDEDPNAESDHVDPILNSGWSLKDAYRYVSDVAITPSGTVKAQRHRELLAEGTQQIGDMVLVLADSSLSLDDNFHASAVGVEGNMIGSRELYKSFVELVNLAQGNPRAADYLKVCLSKCSRAMQAIAARDNKSVNHGSASDVDEMEYEC